MPNLIRAGQEGGSNVAIRASFIPSIIKQSQQISDKLKTAISNYSKISNFIKTL